MTAKVLTPLPTNESIFIAECSLIPAGSVMLSRTLPSLISSNVLAAAVGAAYIADRKKNVSPSGGIIVMAMIVSATLRSRPE